jgi:hypothetical protein
MAYKFLTSAQFNLGFEYDFLCPKDQKRAKEANSAVFDDFIDVLVQGGYDAAFLCGDLFSSRGPEDPKAVFDKFYKVPPSKALLVTTGKNDFNEPGDFWEKTLENLNFSFYKSIMYSSMKIQPSDVYVAGSAFDGYFPERSVLKEALDYVKNDKQILPDMNSIFVAYGKLTSKFKSDPEGLVQPFTEEEVEKLPFTIVLLGGSKKQMPIGTRGYYTGSPMATSFDDDDLGERSFLEFEMDLNKFTAKPVKSSKAIPFQKETIDMQTVGQGNLQGAIKYSDDSRIVLNKMQGEVGFDQMVEVFKLRRAGDFNIDISSLRLNPTEGAQPEQDFYNQIVAQIGKAKQVVDKNRGLEALYEGFLAYNLI